MCINNFRYLRAVEENRPQGEVFRGPVERLLLRLIRAVRDRLLRHGRHGPNGPSHLQMGLRRRPAADGEANCVRGTRTRFNTAYRPRANASAGARRISRGRISL